MDIKKKIKNNNDKPSNQAKKMRIVKWMWTIFVGMGLVGTFVLLLIYNGVIGYMPPIEELKNPHDKFASIVYASDGTTELGRYYMGMGNRVTALEHAKKAAQLDPANDEYVALADHLEYSGKNYRQQSVHYAQGGGISCGSLCLGYLLLRFCCGCC